MQPGQVQPGQAELGQVEPEQAGLGQVVPGQVVPGQVVPGQAQPEPVEPRQAGPEQVLPERAEPRQAQPEQVERGQLPLERAEPGQVQPEQAGPEQVVLGQAQPGQLPLERAEPGQVQPEQAGPEQVVLGQAQPGQLPLELPEPGHLLPEEPPGATPSDGLARFKLDDLSLVASSPGAWANDMQAAIDPEVSPEVRNRLGLGKDDALFNLTLKSGEANEKFLNLTVTNNARRIDRVLNTESNLVRWDGVWPSTPLAMGKLATARTAWDTLQELLRSNTPDEEAIKKARQDYETAAKELRNECWQGSTGD